MSIHQRVIERNFGEIYEEFSKKGSLSDHLMYRIGIGADTNSDHETVWRESECEMYQRSKYLSSTHQQLFHLKSKDYHLAKIHLKHLYQYNTYNSLQLENKQYKAKLESKLPHPRINKSDMYAKSALKKISLYYYNEIKAFVHVQMFSTFGIPRRPKWICPNKGKMVDAQTGERNILSLAFECRAKDILLKLRKINLTEQQPTHH